MTTIGVSAWMFLLVPAHSGFPGQNPESCKIVVVVVVWPADDNCCCDTQRLWDSPVFFYFCRLFFMFVACYAIIAIVIPLPLHWGYLGTGVRKQHKRSITPSLRIQQWLKKELGYWLIFFCLWSLVGVLTLLLPEQMEEDKKLCRCRGSARHVF